MSRVLIVLLLPGLLAAAQLNQELNGKLITISSKISNKGVGKVDHQEFVSICERLSLELDCEPPAADSFVGLFNAVFKQQSIEQQHVKPISQWMLKLLKQYRDRFESEPIFSLYEDGLQTIRGVIAGTRA